MFILTDTNKDRPCSPVSSMSDGPPLSSAPLSAISLQFLSLGCQAIQLCKVPTVALSSNFSRHLLISWSAELGSKFRLIWAKFLGSRQVKSEESFALAGNLLCMLYVTVSRMTLCTLTSKSASGEVIGHLLKALLAFYFIFSDPFLWKFAPLAHSCPSLAATKPLINGVYFTSGHALTSCLKITFNFFSSNDIWGKFCDLWYNISLDILLGNSWQCDVW